MSLINYKFLAFALCTFNSFAVDPPYPRVLHLIINGRLFEVISPGFEKNLGLDLKGFEKFNKDKELDKKGRVQCRVDFELFHLWIINQKRRVFSEIQWVTGFNIQNVPYPFSNSSIDTGMFYFKSLMNSNAIKRNNFNNFIFCSFKSGLGLFKGVNTENKEVDQQTFYMAILLLLEKIYEQDESAEIYKRLFLTLMQKTEMLSVLPGIQYTSHFDHAESDLLRILQPVYETMLVRISNNVQAIEAEKNRKYQEEKRNKIIENVARALAKKAAEEAGAPAAAPDDDDEEGYWDQDSKTFISRGRQRTGRALEAGVDFSRDSDQDSKNSQDEGAAFSHVSHFYYRNEDVIDAFNFLREANNGLKHQFASFLSFAQAKDQDDFLAFIIQVLDIIENKSTQKARVLESAIRNVFGQPFNSNGSERNYRKVFNGQAISLVFHEDHAGAQGWQTSACNGCVQFLGKLNSHFQSYLNAL
jgi:hypothetical protein